MPNCRMGKGIGQISISALTTPLAGSSQCGKTRAASSSEARWVASAAVAIAPERSAANTVSKSARVALRLPSSVVSRLWNSGSENDDVAQHDADQHVAAAVGDEREAGVHRRRRAGAVEHAIEEIAAGQRRQPVARAFARLDRMVDPRSPCARRRDGRRACRASSRRRRARGRKSPWRGRSGRRRRPRPSGRARSRRAAPRARRWRETRPSPLRRG